MPEDWRQWVGNVIDSDLPLLEYIGGSATSGVFATTFSGKKAAIKLSVIDPAAIESRLETLQAVQNLSHPHLLQIYRSGKCQLDGKEFLFVVSEFADENLAQVLPERPLTAPETREFLSSTLNALSYLHGQGFVHAGLKPGNIMAAGEVLKLSSDYARRAGETASRIEPQPHDAPEATFTPASDIWALGVTLVEVMTQRAPAGFKKELEALPSPFREIAPRCLANNPAQRATIAEISECLNPQKKATPAIVPPKRETSPTLAEQKSSSKWAYVVVAMIATIIAAAVAIPKLGRHPTVPSENSTETSSAPESTKAFSQPQEDAQPETSYEALDTVRHYSESEATRASNVEPAMPSASLPETSQTDSNVGIVRKVMPDVSHGALNTIQGKVRVRLKLQVSPSGDVTEAEFVTRGPSTYFANHAERAAREWKFAPGESASAWNLQFDFRRSGTSVSANEVRR